MPALSIRIALDCFYLLIFYSEKFSTDVCRLPYAVNLNLNLSNRAKNANRQLAIKLIWHQTVACFRWGLIKFRAVIPHTCGKFMQHLESCLLWQLKLMACSTSRNTGTPEHPGTPKKLGRNTT